MIRLSFENIRLHLAPVLVLVAVTFLVYGRIIGHDFIFNWDDNLYVVENPAIRGISLSHLKEIFTSYYVGNYAPVQMLSYMFDYELWGTRAGGFLFTNIVIHLLNGILFYRIILALDQNRVAALVGSALFLLHPVQVESVAWVSQRKNLLAMLFFLLSWEFYRQFAESAPRNKWALYLLSVVAFVLALLAKSVAVMLPVVLICQDICFGKRLRGSNVVNKIPYLIAATAVAALAIYTQQTELGGGRAEFHGGTPLATFFTMLTVFVRYLALIVWPAGLSAVYAPTIHTALTLPVFLSALLLLVLLVAGCLLWRSDKRLAFWPVVAVAGIIPVSQIVPLVTLMNDRYLYFPMIGVAALVGNLAARLLARRDDVAWRWGGVAVLALLATVSFVRAGCWRNAATLWSDAVIKSPTATYAWSSLGEVYFRELRVTEAVRAYEHSLELDPNNRMTPNALGPIYTRMGQLDKGYEMLNRFLKIRPNDVKTLAYLGINQSERGNYDEAERLYLKALSLQPDSAKVLLLLGELSVKRQRYEEARKYLMQIEAQGKKDPDAAYRLACLESMAGRQQESLLWLETAIQRGYRDFAGLYENKELSALWQNPRYQMMLQQYFPAELRGE
ncbi:transmembrane and TPR repeat-containing protein F38B6.6 [Geobacter sp. OR-1]|uniref:tetratricopeptide repeat protein n=1 Tax=Geobacter sp. OR-1 TaxID=1266765 RepID=UPI000542C4EE|nr:tetratricopeptide repeat protein [Geobacter sp. OR-1]GAM10570.1 transmembrane and TPR repeat-containing protein F38B6.6 [Geobacter sp. OR-1]